VRAVGEESTRAPLKTKEVSLVMGIVTLEEVGGYCVVAGLDMQICVRP